MQIRIEEIGFLRVASQEGTFGYYFLGTLYYHAFTREIFLLFSFLRSELSV